MPAITSEVAYLLLIFGLMVVPRVFQRLRIPAPLTSFGFGMVAAVFLSAFSHDATLALLATLGISSLFLFAGLGMLVFSLFFRSQPPLTPVMVAPPNYQDPFTPPPPGGGYPQI